MRQLSWDEFADAEGTTYSVDAEGIPPVEMTLETAAELPDSGRAGGSFKLAFRGPFEPILPQAIYRFRSGDETREIFVVPIACDADGAIYEAIFN